MFFDQLSLAAPLARAIHEAGYTQTTEIQHQAIPVILSGSDVLGCAQTGTGKTAAFAIPILQQLYQQTNTSAGARVLVLTPTRELALQVADSFRVYGKYMSLNSLAIVGGVPPARQINTLRKGTDILIATPGRLLDLAQQGQAVLTNVRTIVLDEADHMLDMGFIHDVKKILGRLPAKKQTLLFSATLPPAIRQLANAILHRPVSIQATPVSSPAKTIEQSVYFVERTRKTDLLINVLSDRSIARSLVFTRTKRGADNLARRLNRTGIRVAAIHGNKSQNARQQALSDFKNNRVRVLVATDIAARGIDIDELPHVVNYEIPNVPETYVHRIGRTGRAGRAGVAISFCDEQERADLKNIQRLIGFSMQVLTQE